MDMDSLWIIDGFLYDIKRKIQYIHVLADPYLNGLSASRPLSDSDILQKWCK